MGGGIGVVKGLLRQRLRVRARCGKVYHEKPSRPSQEIPVPMQQLAEFVANHWVLSMTFVALLAALAGNLMGGMGAAAQVGTAEAVRLINREDAVVIDVREAAEFQQGHIANAVNIPMARLGERLAEVRKFNERPLLLCCDAGHTSMRAGAVLKKAGLGKLFSLRGGVGAWRQDNLPIARGKQT
jgi:rhodanese-related sulfurtransferase